MLQLDKVANDSGLRLPELSKHVFMPKYVTVLAELVYSPLRRLSTGRLAPAVKVVNDSCGPYAEYSGQFFTVGLQGTKEQLAPTPVKIHVQLLFRTALPIEKSKTPVVFINGNIVFPINVVVFRA